jgi:plastocyanin
MWMRLTLAIVLLAELVMFHPAAADDEPIVHVRNGRLDPPRLAVHVGEVVRWQAQPGQSLRLELDPHPKAHEVAERPSDVRAMFLKTGEHDYVVTVGPGGQRLRGTVAVGEPRDAWERALNCADDSARRICFMSMTRYTALTQVRLRAATEAEVTAAACERMAGAR